MSPSSLCAKCPLWTHSSLQTQPDKYMIRKVCRQEGSGEQRGRGRESWLQGARRTAPVLGRSATGRPGHLSLMGS